MNDTPRRRLEKKSITEQAAEWLMVLEDKGAAANPAFSDWLRESPTHVQVYLRAATLDTMLKRVDPDRSIEFVRPAPGTVVPDIGPDFNENLLELRSGGVTRRSLWRLAASVAAVGVLLAAAWTVHDLTGSRWETYRTDIGEQRTVELEDGSSLTLNTDSRVQVRFTSRERQLRLLAGEAMFRVQRDPGRPFSVHSGNAVVQAVGTAFNVYRKTDQTIVSVLEGRVAVDSVYLNAGEELRLNARGEVETRSQAIIANVTAWRQRRLVFIDEPLSSIGHELNRYNRSPKIRVEGEAAQTLRYAAMLDADDPESLVAVLSEDPRVMVERRAGQIVVRAR
jgi:transmembrane sensor